MTMYTPPVKSYYSARINTHQTVVETTSYLGVDPHSAGKIAYTVVDSEGEQALVDAEYRLRRERRATRLKILVLALGAALAIAVMFSAVMPQYGIPIGATLGLTIAGFLIAADWVHPYLFLAERNKLPRVAGLQLPPSTGPEFFEDLRPEERDALFVAGRENELVLRKTLRIIGGRIRRRQERDFETQRADRKLVDDEAFARANEIVDELVSLEDD